MKNFIICLISGIMLSSCGGFMDGMAAGMMGLGSYGGYGMGANSMMSSGSNYNYLLDPRFAVQQVQNQEQQEYQAAKRYRPNLTFEQFRAEKAQALQMMKTGGGSSSSSSSTPSSDGSSKSSRRICVTCNGGGKCNGCHGSGLRTDNYFGTGTGTKTCGVCNGRKICSVCGGSGYK